jgi:hypothetical protein
MKQVPEMSPLHAMVEYRDGRPRLMINGTERAPLLYGLTDAPGSRWTWEEMPARNIAVFASNGVRLFLADIWFEQMIGEDDRLDITLARKQVAGVLAQCPDAAVMLRLHVNAPQWWLDRHPDEWVGYADAEPEPERPWSLQRPLAQDVSAARRASFSSQPWLDWATDHLQTFCRDLAASPEGAAVFGLQISNGVYGEWHQFGFIHHDPDTGRAAQAAFRSWLQKRYADESALATAWRQSDLRWESVVIPDSAAREVADCGSLRDPRLRIGVIDYYRFQHEQLADVIIHLAATIGRSWPRAIIKATFFGYFYNLFGRHAAGGHLALDRIIASPEIDCLCGPQSYDPPARRMGGTGHARGLIDPVRRAGKLWLDEMDQATTVSGCPWDPASITTLEDDVAVQIRNILQPVLRGVGAWWYDFGMTAGTAEAVRYGSMGWWDHPRLQADVKRIAALVRERLARPYVRPADVLVVHDPWAFVHTVSRRATRIDATGDSKSAILADPVSPVGIDALTLGLYQSGLQHEEALLSELDSIDLTPFRLVIFATTPQFTMAQRALVRNRVATAGRHVVFTGYAGWTDGEAVGPELGAQLTGFVTRLCRADPAVQTVALDGAEDIRKLGGAYDVPAFGEEHVTVVGRWPDGGASAVCRVEADTTWWSFALAPSQPGLLRALGRRAGCRVLNEYNETTLAGAGLVMVHTLSGGARTLRTPEGAVIETTLPPRSTVVFDAQSGERLLG